MNHTKGPTVILTELIIDTSSAIPLTMDLQWHTTEHGSLLAKHWPWITIGILLTIDSQWHINDSDSLGTHYWPSWSQPPWWPLLQCFHCTQQIGWVLGQWTQSWLQRYWSTAVNRHTVTPYVTNAAGNLKMKDKNFIKTSVSIGGTVTCGFSETVFMFHTVLWYCFFLYSNNSYFVMEHYLMYWNCMSFICEADPCSSAHNEFVITGVPSDIQPRLTGKQQSGEAGRRCYHIFFSSIRKKYPHICAIYCYIFLWASGYYF